MKTTALPTLTNAVAASALLRRGAPDRHTQWATPAPLWPGRLDPVGLRRPALLRFATDAFMEDLQGVLASETPADLAGWIARPESFAEPLPRIFGVTRPAPPKLKLYQPAHGHFYLVAASLVCRRTGLPDRAVQTALQEQVGFVLRRLNAQGDELAWVESGGGKAWKPLSDPSELDGDEEVYPMFSTGYCLGGRQRRLWAGLVPTSSRETFRASGVLSPFVPEQDPQAVQDRKAQAVALAKELGLDSTDDALVTRLSDPRRLELDEKVLKRYAELKTSPLPPAQLRDASTFLLVDFAAWLMTNAVCFWHRVQPASTLPKPTPCPDPSDPGRLFEELDKEADGELTWQDALRQAADPEKLAAIYDGPNPLAVNLKNSKVDPKALRVAALSLPLSASPAAPPAGPEGDEASTAPELPKFDAPAGQTPEYVLRCVYRRPRCPATLSDATAPFLIAGFFDPDAPARPVRISLPDTSLASLRKYRKNVSFLMSKELRRQVQRVSDAKEALKGNVGQSPEFNLGMICSFSLPIITLCAFVVLMIFLILLNIVFWWLPFLRICFPIKR